MLAESRRDLLRYIAALEAGQADRLSALNATCRETAIEAEHARQQADASAAVVAAEADRLRDRLLTAWDAQRDAASQTAQIVLDGPGRFGLRRAAVARASEQLTVWADTWRPYLPTMPGDPRRIAAVAGSADDCPRLQAVFDDHARRHVESSHPQHSRLTAVADAALGAHDRARRDLAQARRNHEDRLAGLDATGHPFDPAAQLADAERDVAATQHALTIARTRIQQLRAEPAFLSQLADRLTQERERWRAQHHAGKTASRPSGPPPVRSRLGVRAPNPADVRHLAPRRDPGPGVPR